MTNLSYICVGVGESEWTHLVFLSVSLSVIVDNLFNVLTLIDTILKKKTTTLLRVKTMHCKYDLRCIACFSGKFSPTSKHAFPFSCLFLSPVLLKAMFTKTVKAGNVLLRDSLTCQLTCHICTNLFLTANLQMLELIIFGRGLSIMPLVWLIFCA